MQRWSRKFLLLQLLSFVTLLISIAGLIGGVSGIIQELQHVALFAKT